MANYLILPEPKYQCLNCGEEHDDAHRASECCQTPYKGWSCDNCGEGYSDEDSAKGCCPQISGAWLCSDCNAPYSEECEARECCAPDPYEIEGGVYQCVHDGLTFANIEEAQRCCSHLDPIGYEGVAVERAEDHGEVCKCYVCERNRKAPVEVHVAAATSTAFSIEFTAEVTTAAVFDEPKPALPWPPIEAPRGRSAFSS